MIPDIHKTVIVIGASQGIGAGLVKAFLDRRYNVVATSRSITKTGGFKASDKLELVDGSIADPSTGHENCRRELTTRRIGPTAITNLTAASYPKRRTVHSPHRWRSSAIGSGH